MHYIYRKSEKNEYFSELNMHYIFNYGNKLTKLNHGNAYRSVGQWTVFCQGCVTAHIIRRSPNKTNFEKHEKLTNYNNKYDHQRKAENNLRYPPNKQNIILRKEFKQISSYLKYNYTNYSKFVVLSTSTYI